MAFKVTEIDIRNNNAVLGVVRVAGKIVLLIDLVTSCSNKQYPFLPKHMLQGFQDKDVDRPDNNRIPSFG